MTTKTQIAFAEADTISISTGMARNVVANTVVFAGLTCSVVSVTEKAVKLEAETRNGKTVSAWFPRKAFNVIASKVWEGENHAHHVVKIAHWFKPTDWTATFLAICEDCTALGA